MRRVANMRVGTLVLVVFALYVAGSAAAWWMIRSSGLGAVFFPPAGITLIAVVSVPRRRWPAVAAAIVAGEFVAGYTVGDATDAVATLGFAVANTVEPLAAALVLGALLQRPPGAPLRPDLTRSREALAAGVSGLAVGPLIGATIGGLTGWWRFDVPPQDLVPEWWLGDALGVVIVAPLCLAWQSSPGPRPYRLRTAVLVVGGAAVAAASLQFSTDLPLLFLVLIGLVVVGALFDVRVTATSALTITTVTVISLAVDPDGMIGALDEATAFWVTQLELLLFTVAAYAVGAEVNDRLTTSARSHRQTATLGELQRLLLPPPTLSGPGFRAVGVYEAAQRDRGVGGDWYLVRHLADGRIVVGVGDIVGHDIEAARTMAAVRSGLLLEAALDPTPHGLLDRLDRFAAVEPSIRYGTAWLGWFDPKTRVLAYSCGGHLPPLLVTEHGTELLTGSNTAVIGLAQGERTSTKVYVPENACLVLYTDGLVERRDETLDVGIERLRTALEGRHLDPRSVVDELLADSPRDDDTILVMIELGNASAERRDPAAEVDRDVRDVSFISLSDVDATIR